MSDTTTMITATVAVAALTLIYYLTPYSKDRSRLDVLYLHIGIRLNYVFQSWFLLKPLLSPHISGHHLEKQLAPDIGYLPKQIIKLVWIVAGAFKTHGILGQILYKFGGVEFILSKLYNMAEQVACEACEEENPKGFTKPMEIEEYDWKNGSPEEFYEKYVKTPKPVILRGFAKDTEATKKWTFDYIVKTYGEEEVFLTNKTIDGFQGKLKDVTDPGNYLHNSEVLFNKYPELMQEMELDRLAPYIKKGLGYTQLFVGLNGTGTPLHCAGNWNWFNMIDGEKTWYFIDPEYTWFCYPFALMGRAASFCLPKYPDDCDKESWKLSKWCPYYKATVRSGDVLLNPPWWWHAIRNVSDQTVAVASRWHGDGSVGRGLVFTQEDYEINRLFDFSFFMGLQSFPFMQSVLATPSPKFDEHTTVRERKNRFTHIQTKFSDQKIKF